MTGKSTSLQVAAAGSGTVVVVRGHWRPTGSHLPGSLVAGVDGSVSQAMLELAPCPVAVIHGH